MIFFQALLLKQIDLSYKIGQDVLPRFSHTAHIIGNILLLIGGLTSQVERPKECSGQTVGVFHLNTLGFQEYHIKNNRNSMIGPPLLFNHTSFCDINSALIYTFGGGSNCFSFGMHMNNCIFRIPLENILL